MNAEPRGGRTHGENRSGRLPPHACFIYSDENERRRFLTRFFRDGARENQWLACIQDSSTGGCEAEWLADVCKGTDGEVCIRFTYPSESYYPEGRFDPADMCEFFLQTNRQALEAGFGGLRLTGNMSWMLDDVPGADRLLEYGAMLNELDVSVQPVLLCQFDARRFSGTALYEILRFHPYVVIQGELMPNPFYRPRDVSPAASSTGGLDG